MTSALAQTATRLGWAGLLPFFAASAAIYMFKPHAEIVAAAIAAYGLAILCFLAGAWWGMALLRRRPDVLVASNLLVVIACAGFVLLQRQTMLVLLAALFVAVIGFERMHPMFLPQPDYYAALRLRLSVVAAFSLLLSALLL